MNALWRQPAALFTTIDAFVAASDSDDLDAMSRALLDLRDAVRELEEHLAACRPPDDEVERDLWLVMRLGAGRIGACLAALFASWEAPESASAALSSALTWLGGVRYEVEAVAR